MQQAADSSCKLPKKMEASHKSQDPKTGNRGKTAVDQSKRPGWRVVGKKASEQTKGDAKYPKASQFSQGGSRMEPHSHLGTSSKQRTARGEASTELGKSTFVNIKTSRQHQHNAKNGLADNYSIANSAAGLNQAGTTANIDRSARLFLLDQGL